MSAMPVGQTPAASSARVVVFSDAFRHRNGVGAYYCDLLDHLEGRVEAAELVCPGLREDGKKQGLALPMPGDRTQKLCLPGLPKALRTMREVRPHVVISASPGPYGLLGLILAKVFRARFCIGYHTRYDKLVEMYWPQTMGGMAGRVMRMLDRVFFRFSSTIFANSHEMRDAAEALGAGDVRLVGTPIEPRLLTPPAPADYASFGPVLFVGRLAPEKNLGAVFDAARSMPETPFVIAGKGPLTHEVEGAAAELENLDYLGWLDREALTETLDRCEALVIPSTVESFGTVAIEAMARQRVVIASEHCGINAWPSLAAGLEVIRNGESLGATLQRYAAGPAFEREAKARRAREAVERFVDETMRQWAEILEEGRRKRAGAT